MADFTIKQGALGPALDVTLKKADGTAQDLTGATVTFSMEHANGKGKITNAAATIVSPAAGTVKYTWTGTDTDTPGQYRGEFKVAGLSPTPVIFPSGPSTLNPTGYIEIEVAEAVA